MWVKDQGDSFHSVFISFQSETFHQAVNFVRFFANLANVDQDFSRDKFHNFETAFIHIK
ncbi:Uncharacterised protein [Actinobacillus equuli]|nr:Uncharacterised protein [Actinobacillus equuli]